MLVETIRTCVAAVSPRAFEAARRAHPGLEPYSDVPAVVDVLRGGARPAGAENLELTRVLLHGFQTGPRAVFGALLLGGYERMLNRTRSEALEVAPSLHPEVDQLVITSFLSAAAYVRPRRVRNAVITRLRQRTRQLALLAAGAEKTYAEKNSLSTGVHEHAADDKAVAAHAKMWDRWQAAPGCDDPCGAWQRYGLRALLETHRARLSPSAITALELVATMPDTSLAAYVNRTTPADSRHRRARYLCLKKQEERARRELQALVGVEDQEHVAC